MEYIICGVKEGKGIAQKGNVRKAKNYNDASDWIRLIDKTQKIDNADVEDLIVELKKSFRIAFTAKNGDFFYQIKRADMVEYI